MSHTELYAITPTGGALPLTSPEQGETVHDLFDNLPLGVYSALRTFEHNKFLGLAAHLDRTEKSMALLGWDYKLDRVALCRALHQACTAYPLPDSRVRFDVLAAPAVALGTDSRLLIALSPFQPVPEAYLRDGVRVDVAPQLHRDRPLVKEASFVLKRRPYPLGHPETYEHLMLDETGRILEGSSSNFYAVRDGVLWTAGEGVLEGITRKILLQIAADTGLPVRLEAIRFDEVDQLDEAFITSSSRGLIPVVRIAGRPVGAERPGAMTQRLMTLYDKYVRHEVRTALETIEEGNS